MFFVQASTRKAMNMTLAFQHNFDAEIQDSRKRFRISKWHLKRTLGIEILTLKKRTFMDNMYIFFYQNCGVAPASPT
jgi:hypothetical protein